MRAGGDGYAAGRRVQAPLAPRRAAFPPGPGFDELRCGPPRRLADMERDAVGPHGNGKQIAVGVGVDYVQLERQVKLDSPGSHGEESRRPEVECAVGDRLARLDENAAAETTDVLLRVGEGR